jgi:drug/metabolite transporter (DMT)-like permease
MNSGSQMGDRNLLGVGYILTGVGLLATMDSVAKVLVSADFSVMQILAIRGWIIVVAMMLIVPKLGGPQILKTTQPFKHIIRITVGFAAPYFFFSSLKVMGLADATVIFFGGATFLMTALSVPLFKEKVGPHRWGAVILGFGGVIIAAQPSEGVFKIEALYAIASGSSYALLVLATRWLGPAEGTFRPVFYYNLGLAVIGSFALPVIFKPMAGGDIITISTMAALAVWGHFCITRAFNSAPVGLLAPFEYTALVWATLLGYFIWSDIPAPNILIGAGIIVLSGLYLVHRETLAARREKREAAVILAADPMIIAAPASVDEQQLDGVPPR